MPHFDCDKIQFEGTSSKNSLAFKHYNPDEVVGEKSMKDHLRFAAPYWHVMRNELGDPFGGTAVMPWDDGSNSVENAVTRVDVFFEFLEKIGIDFYCWHDRDIAPELGDLATSNAALDAVVDQLKTDKRKPASSCFGAQLSFSHPRYSQGGATSPDANVFAYAAAQSKKALECTKELDGLGYTFWGGHGWHTTQYQHEARARPPRCLSAHGYRSCRQNRLRRPLLHRAKSHASHPLTSMTATPAACLNFLREYGLMDRFKLNIETNHATLAGHTMQHELTVCNNANSYAR